MSEPVAGSLRGVGWLVSTGVAEFTEVKFRKVLEFCQDGRGHVKCSDHGCCGTNTKELEKVE